MFIDMIGLLRMIKLLLTWLLMIKLLWILLMIIDYVIDMFIND